MPKIKINKAKIKGRLEYLRGQLQGECISYGELAELQGLTPFIAKDDVELLEAAGVPEFDNDDDKQAQREHTFETTAVVCAHRVAVRYWDFEAQLTDELKERLTNEGEERAKQLIGDGCTCGELNFLNPETDEEIRGWWEIEAQ